MYPTSGVSHGKGAIKPQKSAVFIPNWRDRRASPGVPPGGKCLPQWRVKGRGPGGTAPTYFTKLGPEGPGKLFLNHPPLSQGLDDNFSEGLDPPLYHLNKYIIHPFLHWKDFWIFFLHWLANLSRLTKSWQFKTWVVFKLLAKRVKVMIYQSCNGSPMIEDIKVITMYFEVT